MYTVVGATPTRTLRVLWLLEELGVEFDHVPAYPQSGEVREHYAAGKVPVLIEGHTALTDSAAIMTYLADKHGQFTKPAGTLERAVQDGHSHFVLDEMDALLWTAARHSFVLPEEHRVAEVKPSLKWEFARSLERLEQRLGDGPFLMGEEMTVPDILAAHCCRWASKAGFPEPSEKLAGYFERLMARPAFQRAAGR